MINRDFTSILDLLNSFPDEQTCIDHLEKLRWSGFVVSPFDPISKVYKCKGNKYRCKNTGKYFNVKTNTLFDNTKIELKKWFLAIYLITSHKKGISSLQLSRDIDVTQKTAWFMLQRIRNCFNISNDEQLENEVEIEIDETFVGGKDKNRHADRKVENSQGRSFKDKTPVLGMIERKGRLIAKVVEDTKGETLSPEIIKNG
jgi:transposase-like protein